MTTVDDPRPLHRKLVAADPEIRDELIRWHDAAQALSVEAAGLRNSWQIAEGRNAALLAEVERLRAVRDAAAKYSPGELHSWRCERRTAAAGWKRGEPPVIVCECGWAELDAALLAVEAAELEPVR